MDGVIEQAIRAGFGIPDVERIGHEGWIETIVHQIAHLLLVRVGVRQHHAEAQEQRMRLGRQPQRKMALTVYGPVLTDRVDRTAYSPQLRRNSRNSFVRVGPIARSSS